MSTQRIFVGIDPGISGALAVIHPDGRIELHDTPIVRLKVGKSLKSSVDIAAAASLLRMLRRAAIKTDCDVLVTIEKVNAMPSIGGRRTMGATSAFTFGRDYGVWLGIVAALKMPYQLVAPQTWKKHQMFGMDKAKDASIVRAKQLYPQVADRLLRKKDHGRSDALLICAYGKQLQEQPMQERSTPKRRTARSAAT